MGYDCDRSTGYCARAMSIERTPTPLRRPPPLPDFLHLLWLSYHMYLLLPGTFMQDMLLASRLPSPRLHQRPNDSAWTMSSDPPLPPRRTPRNCLDFRIVCTPCLLIRSRIHAFFHAAGVAPTLPFARVLPSLRKPVRNSSCAPALVRYPLVWGLSLVRPKLLVTTSSVVRGGTLL